MTILTTSNFVKRSINPATTMTSTVNLDMPILDIHEADIPMPVQDILRNSTVSQPSCRDLGPRACSTWQSTETTIAPHLHQNARFYATKQSQELSLNRSKQIREPSAKVNKKYRKPIANTTNQSRKPDMNGTKQFRRPHSDLTHSRPVTTRMRHGRTLNQKLAELKNVTIQRLDSVLRFNSTIEHKEHPVVTNALQELQTDALNQPTVQDEEPRSCKRDHFTKVDYSHSKTHIPVPSIEILHRKVNKNYKDNKSIIKFEGNIDTTQCHRSSVIKATPHHSIFALYNDDQVTKENCLIDIPCDRNQSKPSTSGLGRNNSNKQDNTDIKVFYGSSQQSSSVQNSNTRNQDESILKKQSQSHDNIQEVTEDNSKNKPTIADHDEDTNDQANIKLNVDNPLNQKSGFWCGDFEISRKQYASSKKHSARSMIIKNKKSLMTIIDTLHKKIISPSSEINKSSYTNKTPNNVMLKWVAEVIKIMTEIKYNPDNRTFNIKYVEEKLLEALHIMLGCEIDEPRRKNSIKLHNLSANRTNCKYPKIKGLKRTKTYKSLDDEKGREIDNKNNKAAKRKTGENPSERRCKRKS